MTTEVENDSESVKSGNNFLSMIRAEAPFFLMVVAGIFVFRTLMYNQNYIPSESMQPALEVGDRILVNKLAYGYSGHSIFFSVFDKLPGKYGRLFGSLPKRGDVVTFKHPRDNTIYIKRVIGLPGDRVRYSGGRLYLNGEPTPREQIERFSYREHKGGRATVDRLTETLDEGVTFEIYENIREQRLDETQEFIVPEGNLFVMGDNRDNSVDSRDMVNGVGFLPVENLLGRAERVFYSTYRCKNEAGLRCAKRSFLAPIK